jgi:hypothetical protein
MGTPLQLLLILSLAGRYPVISEVMSNPQVETSGEYLELHNPSQDPSPVTGFRITDGDALDSLMAWDESVHGTFPHQGAVTGTDTIPPSGFALVFELDYPDGPLLDIPDGTVILTTGDHSVCNGLATSDPLTLYRSGGTSASHAVSTWGTPVEAEYWGDRDDDGLDGIPFDPGEACSAERIHLSSPDIEQNWTATAPGGSPGWHPGYPDTCDLAVENLQADPGTPLPGEVCTLSAVTLNCGSLEVSGAVTTLFLDLDADSTADPGEVVTQGISGVLPPGCCDTLRAAVTLEEGNYLLAASVAYPGDQVPGNDLAIAGLVCGQGSFPCISEVICNPTDQDRDELIELFFPGPGVFDLTGCSFTDGDALDQVTPWDPADPLEDPDAVPGIFMPAGSYAVILDSEYTSGTQPWNLAQGTLVLTTANTTLGDGLSGNDPVTLYGPSGCGTADIVSTYGTPVASEDPLLCDDDGLDGIPYDPGKDDSVHRICLTGPDNEANWGTSPEGPTPGGPPPEFQTGTDASVAGLMLSPPAGAASTVVTVTAALANCGTEVIPMGALAVTVWADLDGNGAPCQAEMILQQSPGQPLSPGDTLLVDAPWEAAAGMVNVIGAVSCPSDSFPGNDTLGTLWNHPPGLVINEIMYQPSPGTPEWIELWNGSGSQVSLEEWEFRDSSSGTAVSGSPAVLAEGCYAVVCPDTLGFVSAWGSPGCLLCQPPSWPVLNNTTQPGEAWADQLHLVAPGGQVVDYVPYDDDWGGGENSSLERAGTGLPGYLPSSWAGSAPGGTPGCENDAGQGESPGAFLSFDPDPFSPDGDGTDDVLVILVDAGMQGGRVTVMVYDVCGREVRVLVDDESRQGTCTVTWDGRGGSGGMMPVGRYVVYAACTGESGFSEDCGVVVLARRL